MFGVSFVWLLVLLFSAIQFLVYAENAAVSGIKGRLLVPVSFTAGDNDLRVQLHAANLLTTTTRRPTNGSSSSSGRQDGGTASNQLRISSVVPASEDNGFVVQKTAVASLDIYTDPFSNVTQIVIPCHHLLYGGIYELEVLQDEVSQSDERLKQPLDVRWPVLRMTVTPESIVTYPEHSVDVILEFPTVQCGTDEHTNYSEDMNLPEFWIEVVYCGHDVYCGGSSSSPISAIGTVHNGTTPMLYAELIRGYARHRLIQLRCELFGLAGNYAVKLRAANASSTFIGQTSYVKVDWSDKFVFNVHARSIFPCDNMGIGVLFEYPSCILDHGDRVRVFGKLRADVFSLVPPTSLHYVSERRVVRGQHSLHFDCELFSEKYVEYCFVYVSQAISGAVADVRMDCVPTLAVSDVDTAAGGWGPWSNWTPCSSTCADGTRNRYRFCDSPPPRYGAKFCEGPAVQTERCGLVLTETHLQNISSDCLYGSANLLSGEVPADRPEVAAEIGPGCRCGCIVHLSPEKTRRLIASSSKTCPGRSFWLIKADDSHQIRVKIDFLRLPCSAQYLKIRDGDYLGAQLVVEYEGGTIKPPKQEVAISTNSQLLVEFFSDELAVMGDSCGGGFLVHVQQIPQIPVDPPSNFTFISLMPVRSKITALTMNLTIAHIIAILFVALIVLISLLLGTQYVFRYRKYQLAAALGEPDSPAQTPRASLGSLLVPARAMSTNTLVSDVISLVKLRPRPITKHARLRESVDPETFEKCHSPDEATDPVSYASPNVTTDEEDCPKTLSDEDSKSLDSVQTLTNEGLENSDKSEEKVTVEVVEQPPEKRTVSAKGDNKLESTKELSDLLVLKRLDPRMIELRQIKANCSSIESLETTSSVAGGKSRNNLSNPLLHKIQDRKLSVSQQTLTNANYSPALSMSRKAKIRTTNEKESKEKRNRETLMNRPGSDFSLTNPEDMEMDYYDYNVTNASAAPGSYFNMCPLMWIPSLLQEGDFDDVDEDNQIDGESATQLNLPGDEGIDPGSNSVSPDQEDIQLRCATTAVAKHNNLGCAISILSDDEAEVRSDGGEQEKDNRTTEKKQLAYYKNYYDQMDDIQFADEEEEAAV